MLRRIIDLLTRGPIKYPLYLFKIQHETVNKHLLRLGSGTPQGTPDAFVYLNVTGTTTTTIIYVDVNGTWTALTIA